VARWPSECQSCGPLREKSRLSVARQREPTGRESADDADAVSKGRARVRYGQSNAAARSILPALWRKNVSSSVCRPPTRSARAGMAALAAIQAIASPAQSAAPSQRDDDSHQKIRQTYRQRHGEEHRTRCRHRRPAQGPPLSSLTKALTSSESNTPREQGAVARRNSMSQAAKLLCLPRGQIYLLLRQCAAGTGRPPQRWPEESRRLLAGDRREG
jgi:hypothetical protein